MNKILGLLLLPFLIVVAAPASAAPVIQTFLCEMIGDPSEEDLEAGAAKWLAAARTMKGGANLKASIHYPIAVKIDRGDMLFVIWAPSAAEWGMFWDSYKDSPVEAVDAENNKLVACPDSALWEAIEIK